MPAQLVEINSPLPHAQVPAIASNTYKARGGVRDLKPTFKGCPEEAKEGTLRSHCSPLKEAS